MKKIAFIVPPTLQLLDLAGPVQVFSEAKYYGYELSLEFYSYQSETTSSAGLPFGKVKDFNEAELKEGDYVLMQFGHNDEAKEEKYKDRYTPVSDYKINLIKFITETRARKAVPVLITPVSRLRFDKDGKQQETHAEYTAACYEVAKQSNVLLIDLDKKSRELFQQLGPENAKLLFMQLEPGENPSYPDGQKDNTHFNEYGARRIAEIVLQQIKELHLDLANHINTK